LSSVRKLTAGRGREPIGVSTHPSTPWGSAMGLPSYALQLAAPAIHNAKLLGSAASSSPPLPPRMHTHTLTNPSLRRSRRRFASSMDGTAGRVARMHSRTGAWPRGISRRWLQRLLAAAAVAASYR
jgi:hypothetical protein